MTFMDLSHVQVKLTTWTPWFSAWVKYTKTLPKMTDINGADADTQKYFGLTFPWSFISNKINLVASSTKIYSSKFSHKKID